MTKQDSNINTLELSKLSEVERLEIGTALLKAGYTVRLKKEKTATRSYNYFIQYWKDEEVLVND